MWPEGVVVVEEEEEVQQLEEQEAELEIWEVLDLQMGAQLLLEEQEEVLPSQVLREAHQASLLLEGVVAVLVALVEEDTPSQKHRIHRIET